MSGEEELWAINQMIEFIAYGDPQRARKAPAHIPKRDFRPESIVAYWTSEIVAAVWRLWHGLEEGTIRPTEHGRSLPPSRWSVDRLRQLAPDEPIPIGPFIKELQRSVAHVRIVAVELMKALEPAPEPADAPEPVSFDKLEAAYRELSGKVQNRGEADKLVQGKNYFNQNIPEETREQARKAAGFVGIMGRPRKK